MRKDLISEYAYIDSIYLTESEQPDSSKPLENLTEWARYRGFEPRPRLQHVPLDA